MNEEVPTPRTEAFYRAQYGGVSHFLQDGFEFSKKLEREALSLQLENEELRRLLDGGGYE